jgi:hypothetical protein
MRIVTGSIGTIPSDWPTHGQLDGHPVRLADVETTVDPYDRSNVEVEMPDGSIRRPWRTIPVTTYDDAGRPVGGS